MAAVASPPQNVSARHLPSFREWDGGPAATVRSFGPLGPFYPEMKSFGCVGRVWVPPAKPWTPPDLDELPDLSTSVEESEKSMPLPDPVKAWKFSQANAKIRSGAKVFRFKPASGAAAATEDSFVHAAQLASNDPIEDEMAMGSAKGVGGEKTLFAGVYDGHTGWPTSRLLGKVLIPRVSKAMSKIDTHASPEDVDKTISSSFTSLDDEILNKARKILESGAEPSDPDVVTAIAPAISGSCALLSIYDPSTSTVRVAGVGDSRAVLGSRVESSNSSSTDKTQDQDRSANVFSYEVKALSVDQTGKNKDEVARVEAEHPGEKELFDRSGRLLGLEPTRAFGDSRWKWPETLNKKAWYEYQGFTPRGNNPTPPYVTAEPVITTTKVQTKDFIIMASDGLWDHITPEDAVLCVSKWLDVKRKEDPAVSHGALPVPLDERGVPQDNMRHELELEDGYPGWKTRPEHFVVEDMDNAAVHLLKNVLGGRRRMLFTSNTMVGMPVSRNIVRDDMTVEVIFIGGY